MTPERWRRIKPLLASALERTPEEREPFLEQACAGDAALRADVEHFLAADANGIDPEAVVGELLARPPGAGAPVLPEGTRLGRYEIRAFLGAGGMGEVYRARDLLLDRDVAVKTLAGSASDSAELRFDDEARAASALNHPNIVTVFDVGREAGRRYIVSELLEGGTLRARLDRGPLGVAESLRLARQVSAGLGAAHERGIVHRDLKPENLFLTSDGRLKILDFGIAKRLEAGLSQADTTPARTLPGAILGTIGYSAPEQLQAEGADERSDVFSVGALLYEMLAGRAPFTRGSAAATIAAVLGEAPAPLGADVPGALQDVVSRCLRKRASERYATARQLDEALAGLLQRAARKRRWPLWLGLAAAALAATLAGQKYVGGRAAETPVVSVAVLAFRNASGDAGLNYFGSGLAETLAHELAADPDLEVRSGGAAAALLRGSDARRAGERLHAQAVVSGSVARGEGGAMTIDAELLDVREGRRLWSARYQSPGVADALRIQREIARAVQAALRGAAGAPARSGSPTDDPVAYDLYLRGRHQWHRFSADGFTRAIDYYQQAIAKDPRYALAWAGVADAYSLLAIDGHRRPLDVIPEARRAAARALELDAALPEAHNALGILRLFLEWDWPGAGEALRRALKLRPHYSDAHHYYAHYLQVMGRTEEGIASARRAMELEPLSAIANAELGFAYYCARRHDLAVLDYRRTLELNPRFAFASWLLAQAYQQQGRHAEAAEAVARGLESAPDWPLLRIEQACAAAAAGRAQEARRLVRLLERQPGHVDAGYVAWVHAQLGDADAALPLLERAYAERSSALVWLRVEPKLDKLRGDPRFSELLRRMKLEPAQRQPSGSAAAPIP